MLLLPQGLSRFLFSVFSYPLHSFFNIPLVEENPTHFTTTGRLQKFFRFGLCGPVLNVWKMYERSYYCPQARQRRYHPWLRGRMFKQGIPSHLMYNKGANIGILRCINHLKLFRSEFVSELICFVNESHMFFVFLKTHLCLRLESECFRMVQMVAEKMTWRSWRT